MLRLKRFAFALVCATFAISYTAKGAPITANVDVQIRDVLLLSDISGGIGAANASGLAAFWNGESAGSISTDGEALLAGLAGPSVWASPGGGSTASGSASYTTRASAERNFGGAGLDSDTNSYLNQALSTVADTSGNSIFDSTNSGALISNAEVPSPLAGDFFAHGNAAINNAFKASVLADTSSDSGQALATANDLNGTIRINLDTATEIAAINGGSSAFDIQLYIDTVLASIVLDTDIAGDFARGEFTLSVTARGFSEANNMGTQTVLGSALFGDTQIAGGGTDINSDTTALGPSTSGGLTATPFLDVTVDAATIRSVSFNIQLTTTAEVIPAIPEPTSLVLFGVGMACLAGAGIRRRSRITASKA